MEEGRDRGDLDGISLVAAAYDDYAWSRLASLAGASGHTAEAYERDVRQFVAWAERGGCPSPDELDHTILRRYLAFLTTRQFARRSMARKAASLRAYGVVEMSAGSAQRTGVNVGERLVLGA